MVSFKWAFMDLKRAIVTSVEVKSPVQVILTAWSHQSVFIGIVYPIRHRVSQSNGHVLAKVKG